MSCSGLPRPSLPSAAIRCSPALRRLSAAALVSLFQNASAALAVPTDGIDIPQPTRVEHFNPDQQVCLPQAIKNGFANQLQPFADQPPAVLEQLRRVQQDMTRATLARCVGKGLLPPAEARQLQRELGLQVVDSRATGAAPSGGNAGSL